MRTTARRDDGEYVLDGSKRFITNAGVAGLYTVFAKTDPDAGPRRDLGLPRRGRDARASRWRGSRRRWGSPGSTTGELVFDGCRIPEANRLGGGGDGVQARDADPRPLAPRRGRAGARDRPGRHRLRARVRAHARDDGKADRGAPADRREARRHGDDRPRRRAAALPLRADGRRGRPRERADEGLRDGEAASAATSRWR